MGTAAIPGDHGLGPWLSLSYAELVDQRPAGSGDDVHFTESFVHAVLDAYTAPADLVLDPFAGHGTTLVVAERAGRRAVGVELLPARAEAIRRRLAGQDVAEATQLAGQNTTEVTRLAHRDVSGAARRGSADHRARVVTGDARRLDALVEGPVDLCLTSPPYMTAVEHPQNPLTGYRTLDGDYGRYLEELGEVFRQVARLLRPGGHAAVNVANLVTGGRVTPLAFDLARVVGRHLTFRQEVYLCWDRQPPGIACDYCLVFQRTGPTGRTAPTQRTSPTGQDQPTGQTEPTGQERG